MIPRWVVSLIQDNIRNPDPDTIIVKLFRRHIPRSDTAVYRKDISLAEIEVSDLKDRIRQGRLHHVMFRLQLVDLVHGDYIIAFPLYLMSRQDMADVHSFYHHYENLLDKDLIRLNIENEEDDIIVDFYERKVTKYRMMDEQGTWMSSLTRPLSLYHVDPADLIKRIKHRTKISFSPVGQGIHIYDVHDDIIRVPFYIILKPGYEEIFDLVKASGALD
jgi:hypothetical protein